MRGPTIEKISELIPKHGSISEIGKLRCSLNSRKFRSPRTMRNDQNGKSRITKQMEEAGFDFSKPEKAIKQRNLFEIWLKEHSTKELTEIQRLDGVIKILDTDMTQRVMEKITDGVGLDDSDIKLIRILKESLESCHRMKHGVKHVNLNADIKDIRKMMFDE